MLVVVDAGRGRAGVVLVESRGVVRVVRYIVGFVFGSARLCAGPDIVEKRTAGWVPAPTTMAGIPWVRLQCRSQTWKDQRIATRVGPSSSFLLS